MEVIDLKLAIPHQMIYLVTKSICNFTTWNLPAEISYKRQLVFITGQLRIGGGVGQG